LIIDWYRKDTCSGRYLSYFSGHLLCHKIGTIYSLVDRAFLLSHPFFQQKNLECIIEVLINNGYPLDLIFNKMNIRIKHLIHRNNIEKPEKDVEKDDRKLIVFLYIKNISETIYSSINKKTYMIGYRILNRLTAFIKRHKDKNMLETNNNIVYKISCKNCNASYVGQIRRQLKTRISEHIKNIRLDESKHSVVTKHSLENGYTFDWSNITILDHETNFYKRLISEMIYIKTQENSLNSVEDIECLDSSYFNLLTKICDNKHNK